MIPSKLYIPTSSQNFNSIMSSESISPAAFYEHRNFGMSRFVRVVANNLSDRIALYDCVPQFEIPVSDEDNFPIFIEIQTNCYDDEMFYASEIEGVYYCDRTIYITPFHCKFYFLSEGNYRTVYSGQTRSLTTKMTRLYGNSFYGLHASVPVRRYEYSLLTNSGKDFSSHISFDRRVNKLKGFYLAYLIGVMNDLTPAFVRLYHLVNQVSDTLASSFAGAYQTINQSVQIDFLYEEINKCLKEISNEEQLIDAALQNESEKHSLVGNLRLFLQSHGWFLDWKKQMRIPETYQIRPFVKSYLDGDSEQDAVDNYIKDIMYNIALMRGVKYPEDRELPTICQGTLTHVPEQGFLNFAFTELLQEIYNGRDFVDSRYQFSLSLIKQYKSIVSEDEFNVVRSYANALNKNLNEHESFDINSIDIEDWRAFAAFCQKGDCDDFGKLEDYMIKSEIGTLHKGFALAGLVFGYADMPKTFTKTLTYDANVDFILSSYRTAALFAGLNLSSADYTVKVEDKNLSAPTNPNLREDVRRVVEPHHPTAETWRKIDEAIEVESRQYDPQAFLEILNNLIPAKCSVYTTLEKFFDSSNVKYNSYTDFRQAIFRVYNRLSGRSKKTEYWESIETALELEAKVSDPLAFMSILDDHLKPSDKAYKALAAHFGTGITKTTKSKSSRQTSMTPSLFDDQLDAVLTPKKTPQPNVTFYNDTNAYYILEHLLPVDRKVRAQFRTDLLWFQENFKEKYEDKKGIHDGCYCQLPKDNKTVIDKFYSYCRNKTIPSPKASWVAESWKNINIEKIIDYLRSLYK